MADSESLRPYEPAKEEPSLKPHQSRKPWKRRSSVSHEERGPKQSLSSILPWNYKRKEEEKRASRRKDKSPPRILHLHRHYTYSPGPSAEAPNPPAAAAWLPSPRLPPDEHERSPQPASARISVSAAYGRSNRNSWDKTYPPPRLEERVPPSRRNSQRQPVDRYRQTTLDPVNDSPPMPDRLPRPYSDEVRPSRLLSVAGSGRRPRPLSSSDPRSTHGDFEFPLREQTREEARRRMRDSNRDSEAFEEEPQIDPEKESLREQLRMANAKLAEHEARNAAMANAAEVSQVKLPPGRSRIDSGHHSMYKPPSVQSEDGAFDDDYLDYYTGSHVEQSDSAQTAVEGSPREYSQGDRVRFEPEGIHLSRDETSTMRPRRSDSYKDRSRPLQYQHGLHPHDIQTSQRLVEADHFGTTFDAIPGPQSARSDSQRGASKQKMPSSAPHSNRQSRKNQGPRYPPIVYQGVSTSDAGLISPPELSSSGLRGTGQRYPDPDASRASPPHSRASTRSHRQNADPVRSKRSSYHAQPHERHATKEAVYYIQQTKDHSHRASMESTTLPSTGAANMMRTSRGSSDLRGQSRTDTGRNIKDDDPIEEPPVLSPAVGLRDSKRSGGRRDRPSSVWYGEAT